MRPSEQQNRGRNVILKGTSSGFISNFGSATVTLLSTLFLIRLLGPTSFSQWSFCLLFSYSFGILGIFDLGISDLIQRQVATAGSGFLSTQLQTQVLKARITAFFVVLPLALSAALLMTLTSLGPEGLRQSDSAKALAALFFLIEPLVESQSQITRAVLEGRFQHTVSRLVDLAGRLTQAGGLVALAGLNAQLTQLLSFFLLVSICRLLVLQAAVTQSDRKSNHVSKDILITEGLLREARGFALLKLLGVVFYQVDKLAIILFIGRHKLADYETIYRLQSIALLLQASCSTVVFAASAHAHAVRDSERLSRIYSLGTRVTCALLIPACTTTSVFAPSLLSIIFGDEYRRLWPYVLVALVSAAISSINYIGTQMQVAVGAENELVRLQFLAILVNTLITMVLASQIGLIGLGLGTLSGTVTTWIPYYRRNQNLFTTPGLLGRLSKLGWRIALVAISTALIGLAIRDILNPNETLITLFIKYAGLNLIGLMFGLVLMLDSTERVELWKGLRRLSGLQS